MWFSCIGGYEVLLGMQKINNLALPISEALICLIILRSFKAI